MLEELLLVTMCMFSHERWKFDIIVMIFLVETRSGMQAIIDFKVAGVYLGNLS